jgi:hypothetical protein
MTRESGWRNEVRTCDCGMVFIPKREKQRHCSEPCRDRTKKRLKRSGDKDRPLTRLPRSGDTPATGQPDTFWDGPTMVWPEKANMEKLNPDGSTPGALPGNYPLEYYDDGHPKLPECLNRRPKPALEKAA